MQIIRVADKKDMRQDTFVGLLKFKMETIMLSLHSNLPILVQTQPAQTQIQSYTPKPSVQPLNPIPSITPPNSPAHSSDQFSRSVVPHPVNHAVRRTKNIGGRLFKGAVATGYMGNDCSHLDPSIQELEVQYKRVGRAAIKTNYMGEDDGRLGPSIQELQVQYEQAGRAAVRTNLHQRITVWQDHVQNARGSHSINHQWLITAIREVETLLDKSHIKGLKELKLLIKGQDYVDSTGRLRPALEGVDISALRRPNRHKLDFDAYTAACDRLEHKIQDLIEILEAGYRPAQIGGLPMQAPNHPSKL
jgi:hypothetical protein